MKWITNIDILINKILAYYSRIPRVFRNKYCITVLGFFVFILFFDTNNIMTQISLQRELNGIRNEVKEYHNEYEADKKLLEEIKRDRSTLQKIGRERYLMHYENEDVYYFK